LMEGRKLGSDRSFVILNSNRLGSWCCRGRAEQFRRQGVLARCNGSSAQWVPSEHRSADNTAQAPAPREM